MTKIPPRLAARYEELLGKEECAAFVDVSRTKLPRTIRVNGLKVNSRDVENRLRERNVEFSPIDGMVGAYTLYHLSSLIGGWWETQAGWIHPQELASQLPARVLNPLPGEKVMDMAAAPGNKTTQLAEMMENKGSILAVEPNKARAQSLRYLLARGGVYNSAIALQDALTLPPSLRMDKILLDAPCSGEGLLRKKPQTLKSWSEKYVIHKAQLQTKLILTAADMLNEGGELVYSVCTLSPEECEGVLTTLLHEKPDMRIVPFPHFGLKTRPGLEKFRNRTFSPGMEHAIRLYPQDNNTQSFFVAKLVKGGKA